jgi:hypothetical protein
MANVEDNNNADTLDPNPAGGDTVGDEGTAGGDNTGGNETGGTSPTGDNNTGTDGGNVGGDNA